MGWDERHSLVIERLSESTRPRVYDDGDDDGDVCGCIRETIRVSNLIISARSGNIVLISRIMVTQSAEDITTTRDVYIQ